MTFSNAFPWMNVSEFWFKISLKFVSRGPVNNIVALLPIMAWRWWGDKPLSELMMAWFNNAYMCHSAWPLTDVAVILTQWGRVTHICVSKLTIIGSDNGLSPDRRQAIIWTNAGILSIGPLGTNFSEILIEILTFSFKKMSLKVSSAKRRPFCLGLNVLNE